MTNEKRFAELLQTLRRRTNGMGLLGVEVLLYCAQRPRTVSELEHLTGANNGSINRVINQMAARYDATADKVRLPQLHLLNRLTKPEGRGFQYCLTRRAEELCGVAGLSSDKCYDQPRQIEHG